MVIDAHQHFLFPSRIYYPWLQGEALAPLQHDFGPEDLRPLLAQNGVDKSILVQTRSSLEETYAFLKIAHQTDYVAGVVGWLNLCDPHLEAIVDDVLESEHGHYLVGVRHQVHDEPDPNWLLQEAVQGALEALAQRGLSYNLLTRVRELPACLQTAQNHPEVSFILDHIAKPNIAQGQWADWLEAIAPLSQLPNVWVKLSGMVTEAQWHSWQPSQIQPYVSKVLELFGSERCIFGSDWPVCVLASSYGGVKGALEQCLFELSPDELERVFAQNALEAYSRLHKNL